MEDSAKKENGPSVGANGEFLRPADPPVRIVPLTPNCGPQSAQTQAFKQQLSRMMPKYTNRKGRTMSRKNVISRQLLANRTLHPQPYLIDSAANNVKMRLMRQSSAATPSIVTIPPQQQQQPTQSFNGSQTITIPSGINVLNSNALIVIPQNAQLATPTQLQGQPAGSSVSNQSSSSTCDDKVPQIVIPENSEHLTLHRASSPTGSISSLFNDSSLSDLASNPTKGDHFLDSVLENSNSSVLRTPPRVRPTPPSSPSRALNESWLPELSLSSFLNPFESPSKSTSVSGLPSTSGSINSNGHHLNINEDSSHSTNSEVERQFMSMMNENSVDFTMKFAKLASHVEND